VKDNTDQKGVNANSALPDFGQDYRDKYVDGSMLQGTNVNNGGNSNTAPGALAPPYGNLSSIISPPANYNGSINQPEGPGTVQGNNEKPVGNGPLSTGIQPGGPGSSSGSGLTRVKPGSADIIEASNRDSSGGRNSQESLFFYDRARTSGEKDEFQQITVDRRSPSKPTFGAVLPVKMLGRLHTLGANGLVRMALTRSVKGSWGSIPRGTIFVGRVQGGEGDRVFVSLMGYIDSQSNRLITMGGDLQGTDGALGLKGDRKSLNSRWKKVFSESLSIAKDLGSAYLLGRRGGSGGSSVSYGADRLPDALENKDTTKYVIVPAGTEGYLVINDLPPAFEKESDARLASNKVLSDDEILKMVAVSDPGELERIMPTLSSGAQQIARRALDRK
jgi:hypothetical protein